MPEKSLLTRLARWETLTVVLLIGAILYGVSSSSHFWTGDNFNFLTSGVVEIAIMALALTFVIVAAEIDLSVASVLGLSSALIGVLWDHNWPMELILPTVLVMGAVAGLINGLLVTRLGLPSLAVTIGTLALYRGLAFVILGDKAVADFPTKYTNLGFNTVGGTNIPDPIVLFAVLALIFGFVLHRTTYGRSIFAIGANEEAAYFSGLRVKRIKTQLFVLSGLISALAGIVYTFRFSSARADNGTGLELSVVAAVLLGGVSIFGGRGLLPAVVCAVFLLGTINNALTLNDVAADIQTIVTGSLLLLSVLGPSLAARIRARRATRPAVVMSTPTT